MWKGGGVLKERHSDRCRYEREAGNLRMKKPDFEAKERNGIGVRKKEVTLSTNNERE